MSNKLGKNGGNATGAYITDMGESFGGWGVRREVNGIQGMVRLGISIVDNAPGAAVALSKDGTEVAALRFNESKVQLQKSAEGNKMINLATATPPEEYDLPLAEGVTAIVPASYWKTQEGIVFVAGWVQGAAISMTVATLPAGYRPKRVKQFTVPQSTDADKDDTARIEISASGAIILKAISNEARIADGLSLCCSFVAAN